MLNPIPRNIKTVSDFQRKTKPTFDEIAQSKDPVLVMNRNQKVGVFLSPTAYESFVEAYEDFIDGKDLEQAANKPKQTFYTLDDVEAMILHDE